MSTTDWPALPLAAWKIRLPRCTCGLRPQSVAAFYAEVMALLAEMSLPVKIWPVSVEMPTAVRLDQDLDHDAYDRAAVSRVWRALRSMARVLTETRCGDGVLCPFCGVYPG